MPTIHVSIIALSSMIFFEKLWTSSSLMNYLGGAAIIGSLLMGHMTSYPTEREPLPSNLFYNYDVTTGQAHFATEDSHINIGNELHLEGATRSQLNMPYKRSFLNVKTDVKPSVSMPQLVYDTLQSNVVQIINKDEVFNTRFHISEPSNVRALYINDQEVFTDRDLDESMIIEAFAMIAETMTIRILKRDPSKEQVIGVNSNFHTLPIEDKLPAEALRTDGYTGVVYEVRL